VLSKLRARLTYANVVATLALFLALGGSSYAAIKITSRNVPKDALTGADIKNLTGKDVKNNSLTGADVKNLGSGDVSNGKLLAEDFAPGQLPKGEKGLKGDKGDSGARGPSDAYVADGGGKTLAPGKYVVWLRTRLASTTGAGTLSCDLDFNSAPIDTGSTEIAAGKKATLMVIGSIDTDTSGPLGWSCNAPSNTAYESIRAIAIQVETFR
jgi:hypothetical protein